MAPLARAQENTAVREDQMKAAYLFNFMKFVEWPALAPQQPLTMCLVGAAAVHEALGGIIAGKKVGEHAVLTRILPTDGSPASAGCSLIYLDSHIASSHQRGSRNAEPILTVSDASGFAREGGMIELYMENNRLRFIVNLFAAQGAGLHLSASLLQLATTIDNGSTR
jgi:hypothetical protein